MSEQQYDQLKAIIKKDEIQNQFIAVLGERQSQGYIMDVLLTVRNNSALMDCTPQSIITAAMRAATLRLSVDAGSGQAYLVPFNSKNGKQATLIVGYRGLMQMATRTGQYRYINTSPIYDGEVVEEDRITGVHKLVGAKLSNKIVGWLCYLELFTGYSKSVYMSVEEIHEHAMKYSKSYDDDRGFWKKSPREMERKTILRLTLSKWGYLDPHDLTALKAVEENDKGADIIDVPIEEVSEPEHRSSLEVLDELGFTRQAEGRE